MERPRDPADPRQAEERLLRSVVEVDWEVVWEVGTWWGWGRLVAVARGQLTPPKGTPGQKDCRTQHCKLFRRPCAKRLSLPPCEEALRHLAKPNRSTLLDGVSKPPKAAKRVKLLQKVGHLADDLPRTEYIINGFLCYKATHLFLLLYNAGHCPRHARSFEPPLAYPNPGNSLARGDPNLARTDFSVCKSPKPASRVCRVARVSVSR